MTAERCRYFRSKTMFVTGQRVEASGEENESPASAYCWCNHTMTEIGEDYRLVGLPECSDPKRRCYQLS